MTAKLRAGLVGLGVMGRHHARVLRSLDGVELVAVVDVENRDATAGVPLLGSVEQLIDTGIDYCVVAAPTCQHECLGMSLAEARVPTLIEKPLASNLTDATRLATTFERARLVGAVGHIERYNPALRNLRGRLADGELGSVYQVVTRRQGPFPDRIADVGAIKDLATHDIDLTAWVTEQPYISVAARTASTSGRRHEDLVAMVGLLRDRTVTSHLVNWLSPTKERVVVVTGERGCVVADTLSADLTFYMHASVRTEWEAISTFRGGSEGDVIRYAIAKPEPLRTEHEAFRDAVRGQVADIVTMRQGLAAVRVAEAAIESSTTGATVALPDDDRA